MILSCYPDYGKARPEYVVNVIDCFATFPEWVMVELCNLRTGIPAQSEFLPSIALIVKAGDQLIDQQRQREERAILQAAIEKRQEEHKIWWAGREVALVKAKEEHPTAYLNENGELMYHPDIERGTEYWKPLSKWN